MCVWCAFLLSRGKLESDKFCQIVCRFVGKKEEGSENWLVENLGESAVRAAGEQF